jgi:LDH2 family malate/lactate/ureidoglycolate dehydrogenase
MKEMNRISVPSLKRVLEKLFGAAGLQGTDAEFVSECMVQTNLWGVDSHGVLRAPIYLQRIRSGAVNPSPAYKTVAGGEQYALELIDGDAGLGYLTGRYGMERAIRKAEKFGTGTVIVKKSNHFGAAALFARMAAEAGMIGIATTNVIPNIGMKGNKCPAIGNNPVALAAPLTSDYPFCLDISMSAVAGGKLLLAAKKGERIPKDWAVTADGLETDDPDAGFKGFLLPLGQHKGFGLALFIDIITGVLSGGAFAGQLKSMYKHPSEPSETTHFFQVIQPEIIMPKAEFLARMARWSREIHATPMVEKGDRQLIPGEMEYMTEVKRLREGIPLPPDLIDDLKKIAGEYSVAFDLEIEE